MSDLAAAEQADTPKTTIVAGVQFTLPAKLSWNILRKLTRGAQTTDFVAIDDALAALLGDQYERFGELVDLGDFEQVVADIVRLYVGNDAVGEPSASPSS